MKKNELFPKTADSTAKLLGYVYGIFCLIHVIGLVKLYADPLFASKNILLEIAFWVGIPLYLVAFMLARKGQKNAAVLIFFVEQFAHSLIIFHFDGLAPNLLILSIWNIAVVLIFLSSNKPVTKVVYVLVVLLSVGYLTWHGYNLSENQTMLTEMKISNVLFLSFLITGALGFVAYIYNKMINTAQLKYEKEHNLAQELLHNILPAPIAEQLKTQEGTIVNSFEEVTILFADIVDFTKLSEKMTPADLVELLDDIFVRMDELVDKYGLEKIKTIGDAYMVAGGLPITRSDHAVAVASLSLDMMQSINQMQDFDGHEIQLRIGINSGPVVAGVIGKRKFSYDLWGDSVNIAARMESHGEPGKIQVTSHTFLKLKDKFIFEHRGEVEIKGKGRMQTYYLIAKKPDDPL